MSQAFVRQQGTMQRRDFLRLGSMGLLGLGLSDLLRLEARGNTSQPTAKSVILIWLGGGPATIDMWDPKPDAPQEIRGEFQAIETAVPGIRIGEHLPKTAQIMDRCLLIRSLHHGLPVHGPGTQYMLSGNRPTAASEFPSLGSLAAHILPPRSGIPPYFVFDGPQGRGAGYLGSTWNPFDVTTNVRSRQAVLEGVALPEGFTINDLENRTRLHKQLDQRFRKLDQSEFVSGLERFQQEAVEILRTDSVRKAFRFEDEPESLRERYGRGPLSMSALVARRLLEAGARFVTIGGPDWDTHSDNFTRLQNQLLPPLDSALSALISDLDERGMLDETLVCCAGEFGRTPQVNGAAGRDHWARAMSVLVAGGGLPRGAAYGSTDEHGKDPNRGACTPDDLAATLMHRLGILPDQRVLSTTGRPMTLFPAGHVISELSS